METRTFDASASRPPAPEGRPLDLNELAIRIRWRRYFLAAAAANPYLERPAYAA